MAGNILDSYCAQDVLATDHEMRKEYELLLKEGFASPDEAPPKNSKMKVFADCAFEYYASNLLANPWTVVKNLASTSVPLALRTLETATAAGLSQGLKAMGLGAGEVTFKEAVAEAHGIADGFKDAITFMNKRLEHLDHYKFPNEKLLTEAGLPSKLAVQSKVENARRAITNENIDNELLKRAVGFVGAAVRTPFAILTDSDIMFKVMNYRAEISKLAMRQAIQKGGDRAAIHASYEQIKATALEKHVGSIAERALLSADERTYTNNPQGVWNKWMANKGHDLPGLRWIIPFRRTMVNVLNYGIERTPLGLGQSATRRAIFETGGAAREEALGRMAFGTAALVSLGALLGDRITGEAPRGAQEKDLWMKDGNREYSIRFGDVHLPLDTLGQFSPFLKAYANYSTIASNADTDMDEDADPTVVNTAGELLFATADALVDDHWVGNLATMMTSFERATRENSMDPIIREMGTMLGSSVPKPVTWAAAAVNPNVIDKTSPFDGFNSKIPGIVNSMTPSISLWGDPIRRDHFLDPQLASRASGKDEVATEILRLQMHIPVAERSPKGVSMDKKEYAQYMILSGKGFMGMPPLRDSLKEVMMMPVYKDLVNDEGRANLIKSVILDYRNAARDYMLMNSDWGKRAQKRELIEAHKKGDMQ